MLSSLRRAFVLLFVAFPLIEIAVLIKVGEAIGFWPTMLLLIAAAILGSVSSALRQKRKFSSSIPASRRSSASSPSA